MSFITTGDPGYAGLQGLKGEIGQKGIYSFAIKVISLHCYNILLGDTGGVGDRGPRGLIGVITL